MLTTLHVWLDLKRLGISIPLSVFSQLLKVYKIIQQKPQFLLLFMMFICSDSQLCIPNELEGGDLGGHFGRDKTLSFFGGRYLWLNMSRDMERLVKRCKI